MTRTTINASVKSLAGGHPNGSFEVVLSTGAKDRDGEVVVPGAFNPLPKSIPIHSLHQFATQLPIARAEPFYDGNVLKGRGYYASTPEAQAVRTLVSEGIVDSVSVGFMRHKSDRRGGVPHVTKGTLLEASFVGVPANPEALVTASKGLRSTPSLSAYPALAAEIAKLSAVVEPKRYRNVPTDELVRQFEKAARGVVAELDPANRVLDAPPATPPPAEDAIFLRGYGYGGQAGCWAIFVEEEQPPHPELAPEARGKPSARQRWEIEETRGPSTKRVGIDL